MAAELSKPAARLGRSRAVRSLRSVLSAVFRGERGLALLTMAIPSAVFAFVTQLWSADLNAPFSYEGDSMFALSSIKGILENPWIYTNSSLGAPFGQQTFDYPNADNLNVLVIKALGLFSHDPAVVFNLFYLITYPLVALSALLVLRKLGLSRGAALFSAVLFTLLPYHFAHGETHLFLSAYWAVPLGAYLALSVLEEKPLLTRRSGRRGPGKYLSRATIGTLACCLIAGSTGLYYACFSILLIGAAALLVGAVRRSWSGMLRGLGVSAILGVVLVLNLAPSLVYARMHPSDSASAKKAISNWRQPSFSELYSVKLAYLVLPVDGHRIGSLARAKLRYDQTTSPPYDGIEASSQTLGAAGDIGFIALLVIAFAACVGFARWRPPPLLRNASFLTIVAFLYGTVGGFSTIVAYWISPNLHAPARIALFIGFFSLLATGALIDLIRSHIPKRLGRGGGFTLAIAALLALGVLDMTTSHFKPDYTSAAVSWRSDAAFAAKIQNTLPRGSEVFELPYMAFPENGSFPPMRDYDLARPYLHTTGLRWSYGAMKGTSRDWSAALTTRPPEQVIPAIAAAGFSAIYIDRNGYPDSAASLESQIESLTGVAPVVSSDNRFSFFDLRAYAKELRTQVGSTEMDAAKAAVLHPFRFSLDVGFRSPESSGTESWQWSSEPSSEITIFNSLSTPIRIRFSTTIRPPTGVASTVWLSFPDGTHATYRLANVNGAQVNRDVLAPPGTSYIKVRGNGPPAGNPNGELGYVYLQLVNPSLISFDLLRLSDRARALARARSERG
jgi:hypothetical protein